MNLHDLGLLAVAVAVVCVAMFFQDVFGEGLTISSARGLQFFPGFFDGMGDYASKYGTAAVAATTGRYGLGSWQLLVVITACACTSFFTSNAAAGKESMILPRDRTEKITAAELWRRVKAAA